MQALLEPCEGELGCVLWDDAVRCILAFSSHAAKLCMFQVLLFLPWLASDIAASLPAPSPAHGTALCLGEGIVAALRSRVCHTDLIHVLLLFCRHWGSRLWFAAHVCV
jgi:hypothetical protein